MKKIFKCDENNRELSEIIDFPKKTEFVDIIKESMEKDDNCIILGNETDLKKLSISDFNNTTIVSEKNFIDISYILNEMSIEKILLISPNLAEVFLNPIFEAYKNKNNKEIPYYYKSTLLLCFEKIINRTKLKTFYDSLKILYYDISFGKDNITDKVNKTMFLFYLLNENHNTINFIKNLLTTMFKYGEDYLKFCLEFLLFSRFNNKDNDNGTILLTNKFEDKNLVFYHKDLVPNDHYIIKISNYDDDLVSNTVKEILEEFLALMFLQKNDKNKLRLILINPYFSSDCTARNTLKICVKGIDIKLFCSFLFDLEHQFKWNNNISDINMFCFLDSCNKTIVYEY